MLPIERRITLKNQFGLNDYYVVEKEYASFLKTNSLENIL